MNTAQHSVLIIFFFKLHIPSYMARCLVCSTIFLFFSLSAVKAVHVPYEYNLTCIDVPTDIEYFPLPVQSTHAATGTILFSSVRFVE